MGAKTLAVFTGDFPDDQVEDERDIVLYGGRNVAEAVRQIAIDVGGEASRLLYEEVKGWSFEVRFMGRRYGCLATSFHPKFFLTFDPPALGSPASLTFLDLMDTALRGDHRVHDLQWYDPKDAPDPWEGAPPSTGPSPAVLEWTREARQHGRTVRRRRNVGCLLGLASLLAIVIGGAVTTATIVDLLVHNPVGAQLVAGPLLVTAGGLGFRVVFRWGRRSREEDRLLVRRLQALK